jgi:hypothetical protein
MGRIIHGSDCHSQRLNPLLRGRTERFGVVGQSDPCGVGLSQYVNVYGANHYSRMVWVGMSQCLNGGWPNHQGTRRDLGGVRIERNSALIQGESVARVPL